MPIQTEAVPGAMQRDAADSPGVGARTPERQALVQNGPSNWDGPDQKWVTGLVLAVSLGLPLVVWRIWTTSDEAKAIEAGLGYLPFMFGTFAAITAGRAVYAKLEGRNVDEYGKFCFEFCGLQLFLAACSQAASQIYPHDGLTTGFLLGAALIANVVVAFKALMQKNIQDRTAILIGFAFTFLGMAAALAITINVIALIAHLR
ncbi:hypothetical protein [Pandoraea sputorum]|uniref:hypothetical protein n=1 Tax=Pandoraea sputorum TaxID=93222 RepID=UPI001241308E|nr:hypothetical protein [Pandoraea sputorum]VVE76699.1 hypothetical protein PSP31120_00846 [Pandoraea sputorum]